MDEVFERTMAAISAAEDNGERYVLLMQAIRTFYPEYPTDVSALREMFNLLEFSALEQQRLEELLCQDS